MLGFLRKTSRRADGAASPRTLSLDQFASITQPCAAHAHEAPDRRAEVRVAIGKRATLRTGHPSSAPFPVLVRDLSPGGIGLLADRPVPQTGPCWVYIPKNEDADDYVAAACTVLRCARGGVERDTYFVAAAFIEGEPPHLTDVQSLADNRSN